MAKIPWIDYTKLPRPGAGFTLTDLYRNVSSQMPCLYQSDVIKGIDAVLERMAQALADGQHIILYGFGRFEVIEKQPRYCWNPMKRKYVKVGARRKLKFQADDEFREKILGKEGLWKSGYKKRQKLNPPLGAAAVAQAAARKADWERRRKELGIPSIEEQELLEGMADDEGTEQ